MIGMTYMNLDYKINGITLLDYLFNFNNENTESSSKETKNPSKEKIKQKVKNESSLIDIISSNSYKKNLILKLERYLENFLFRKNVKSLLELHKIYYFIYCSVCLPNLSLSVITNKSKNKIYPLNYNSILKRKIAFVPRKSFKKKSKLKFYFENNKKEIIIESKLYNTKYENGKFFNEINLEEIREKEKKDFDNLCEIIRKIKSEKKLRTIDLSDDIDYEKVRDQFFGIITRKRKLSDYEKLIVKGPDSNSSLKKKNKIKINIEGILKSRPEIREKSDRKISFGDVKFSY